MGIKFKDKHLDEVVSQFADEELLYIGSSSSYFFIGTKVEYEALIDKISEHTINSAEKNLLVAKSYADPAISKINDLEPETTLAYYNGIKELLVNAERSVNTVISYLSFINKFKPMRRRYVKDVERMETTPGFRIIVEGYEQSRYWFKEEFDKEWVKNGDSHDYEFVKQNDRLHCGPVVAGLNNAVLEGEEE